ncbi:hypothetical protein BW732_01835 [Vagococcus penaei]|uniref:Polysaccharide pyruvyl transferase domain-containing protein n=2 Tax=Vagococcus penaei TaxID=633807 RepID=A0A1Q2D402_9ENTE|nr:polysaccharide pyruvyl transferase family protein [Vagococcus penaei]AQP53089.1 hypothetical protein BW732_01835 [Vagococcus penaei]
MKINDLITVRDDYSYKLISHLNLKSCFLIDDFVYNIAKTPYILENVEKVNSNNEKYILGISAYRSPIKGDSNIASYRVLADICDNVIEKRGAKVKLFSFDSENENDLVSAFYIKKYAKHANEIEIVPYLNDEINFLNNFVSCDRIIGIRFHSLIISDVYGIPFYPISYSNKTNNFLTDIGYKGNINNYSDLEINKQRILSDILSDTFFISNKSNNSEQHLLEFENLIRKIETNRVVNNCE